MASERSESSQKTAKNASGPAGADLTVRRAPVRGRDKQEPSSDPDVLVAQIERTREDLAETLDEIVDRVSPKRVAQRSSKKVAETVKEAAANAKEVLTEKAATAKEVVGEKTASAKVAAAARKDAVTDRLSGNGTAGVSLDTDGARGLPPVTGVEVPVLAPRAPAGAAASAGLLPAGLPKEVVVGALAALVGLWLLWRRRD